MRGKKIEIIIVKDSSRLRETILKLSKKVRKWNVWRKSKKYKNWDNNVFSFLIPKPNIRPNEDSISIEHYYPDDVLKKRSL